MTDRPEDLLAAHFDRLVALPPAQRASALDALALPAAERAELEALLAADAIEDARLEREIADAAQRLGESADLAPAVGTRLDPWRVLRELGSGGMGTVLLAERADGAVEQQVAIKLMRGFPTEDGRRRLRQERQVLAQLDHPHIARLLDAGEAAGGQPYFVMEYVDGVPVTTQAARAGLDRRARIDLLDRIAEAVSHAHQRLVIHRDLKPSNVLVRADGTPKLLDFGVAKLLEIGDSGAATSTRVWTPGYASPEQKAGEPVTTATDVFALGVLLRELLTGCRPDGASCDPPLPAVPVDADLAGVIAKATAESAADRYPTVEALRDDLARWRDGRPVRAARDTALYRARKFVRRHRGSVSVVLLVLVALAIFVWRLGVERDRAREAEALAEQRRVAAEQAADTAQATLDFFGGLLQELSPDADLDAPITIRRMLERASERLARELPAGSDRAPLVNAFLGELHGLLGDSPRAVELLGQSLEVMRARALDRGPAFGRTASAYANELVNVGRLEESSEWIRRAAAAYRARGGATNAAMAAVHDVLDTNQAERFDDSVRIASAALAQAITDGASAEAITTLDYMLVSAYNGGGRSQEAIAALSPALVRLESAGLGRSMFAYQLHYEEGRALYGLDRGDEALASLDTAREIYVAGRGETGMMLIVLDEWRAGVLGALGRYREAGELSVAIQTRWAALGRAPDALSRNAVANTRFREGDHAAALAEARAVLSDPQLMEGLTAGQQQQARWTAARIAGLSGDSALARRTATAARASAATPEGALPDAQWDLLLGEVAFAENRIEEAASLAERAALGFEKDPALVRVYGTWLNRLRGRVALARGDLATAEREFDAAAARQSAGARVQFAAAQLDLARLRDAQGRDAEARELLRMHLPVLRSSVRPEQADRAAAEALALRLGAAR